jgi:hypothetical protein
MSSCERFQREQSSRALPEDSAGCRYREQKANFMAQQAK